MVDPEIKAMIEALMDGISVLSEALTGRRMSYVVGDADGIHYIVGSGALARLVPTDGSGVQALSGFADRSPESASTRS